MVRSLDRSVIRVSSVFAEATSTDPSTILDRHSRSSKNEFSLTPSQSAADSLVGVFCEQASDWKSLASMTVGGLAYRLGKAAVLGPWSLVLRRGDALPALIRGGSVAVGLTSEVTAYEFTNRFLTSVQGFKSKVSSRKPLEYRLCFHLPSLQPASAAGRDRIALEVI